MTAESDSRLPAVGDWAVLGSGGVVHLAETVGGLPRGGALCGAVGTAFVVSAPPTRGMHVCERCLAAARSGSGDAG